jgi:hypothetical protein
MMDAETIIFIVTSVVLFVVGYACGDLRRGTLERLKHKTEQDEPDTLEKLAELRTELERGEYVMLMYPPTGMVQLHYHPEVLEPVPLSDPTPASRLVGLGLLRAPLNYRDISEQGE